MSSKSQTRNPKGDKYSASGIIMVVVWIFIFLSIIQPFIGECQFEPSLSVSSATVYPFNISSSRLTASWNISLSFENQFDGYGIDFVRVQAAIYYGPHFLSNASIRPFFLNTDCTVTRQARLMAHSERVDEDAAESMIKDRALLGAVDFRVVAVIAWRGHVFTKGTTHFMRLSCENVTVGFLDAPNRPGVMLGPPEKCKAIHG